MKKVRRNHPGEPITHMTLDSVTGLSKKDELALTSAQKGEIALKIHIVGHCHPGSDYLYSLYTHAPSHYIFIAHTLYTALRHVSKQPVISLVACSAADKTFYSNSFAQKLHYYLNNIGIQSTVSARNKTVIHTSEGKKVTLNKSHEKTWSYNLPFSMGLYSTLQNLQHLRQCVALKETLLTTYQDLYNGLMITKKKLPAALPDLPLTHPSQAPINRLSAEIAAKKSALDFTQKLINDIYIEIALIDLPQAQKNLGEVALSNIINTLASTFTHVSELQAKLCTHHAPKTKVIFEFGPDGRQSWRFHEYKEKSRPQRVSEKAATFFQTKEKHPSEQPQVESRTDLNLMKLPNRSG